MGAHGDSSLVDRPPGWSGVAWHSSVHPVPAVCGHFGVKRVETSVQLGLVMDSKGSGDAAWIQRQKELANEASESNSDFALIGYATTKNSSHE